MQPTLMTALLAEDQDFGGASSDPAYIDGEGLAVGAGRGGGAPPRSFGDSDEPPPLPAASSAANNSSSASATPASTGGGGSSSSRSQDSGEVVRLANALQEFYAACGVKKSDADLRRSARTFAGVCVRTNSRSVRPPCCRSSAPLHCLPLHACNMCVGTAAVRLLCFSGLFVRLKV